MQHRPTHTRILQAAATPGAQDNAPNTIIADARNSTSWPRAHNQLHPERHRQNRDMNLVRTTGRTSSLPFWGRTTPTGTPTGPMTEYGNRPEQPTILAPTPGAGVWRRCQCCAAHGLVTGLVHRAAGVRCGSTSRCAPAACNAWGRRMPCMDAMHGPHDSDIFQHTDSKLTADRSIGQQRRHRRTRCLELRIPGQASLNWAQSRRESRHAPACSRGTTAHDTHSDTKRVAFQGVIRDQQQTPKLPNTKVFAGIPGSGVTDVCA